jgi:hypothetical protein
MPDGDRFQWHLKGKGWRKLYNLLTSGASTQVLSDAAGTAIAKYLREAADIPFSGFIRCIQERVARPPLFQSVPIHGFGDSVELCCDLEDKAGECSFAEPALLAQRAALKAYAELKDSSSAPDALETAAVFAGKLGCEIAERKCLAVVRDEVARQAHRSLDDQVAFEQEVMSGIERVARKLGPAMYGERCSNKIRAPRGSVTTSTETLLAKALPISPEAR